MLNFYHLRDENLNYQLKESKESDLALAVSELWFSCLCDVLGGLPEGGFSLTFSSEGHPICQPLIHRSDFHYSDHESLGSIRFGTLSSWGLAKKGSSPALNLPSPPTTIYQEIKIFKQHRFVYWFGQKIPYHYSCLSIQPSTSGSMPGRLQSCCIYSIYGLRNLAYSQNQTRPSPRVPCSSFLPSAGPSSSRTFRVPRRRPVPARALQSPCCAGPTLRTSDLAPRHPAVTACLRFVTKPRGLPISSAVNVVPSPPAGPTAVEEYLERRRLFSILSSDSSEAAGNAALAGVQNLFLEWWVSFRHSIFPILPKEKFCFYAIKFLKGGRKGD